MQVVLLCLSVLWTNVAAFLAREIITELTRDEALYLPKVHAHGLVFDPTLCRHWCDLCEFLPLPLERGKVVEYQRDRQVPHGLVPEEPIGANYATSTSVSSVQVAMTLQLLVISSFSTFSTHMTIPNGVQAKMCSGQTPRQKRSAPCLRPHTWREL